ncbi:MAG: phosphotriesterase-related protein [Deltaproteobacteria bacterium]|nr:phosphotriesterase-related protein [Deltaproteobacteria bacterium]
MPAFVETVTGPLSVDALGATLIHEHVVTGMPGWDTDANAPRWKRHDMMQIAKDKIGEMQDAGIRSMVDPCPSDLARDIEFSAEISQATAFPIVAAAGLYNEFFGLTAYWKMRGMMGADVVQEMADAFITEITEGVGASGVKPGLIKVATGSGAVTDYERQVFAAATRAATETDVPIITHTDDGALGLDQQAMFEEGSLPPHRAMVGHCCGSNDHDYHWRLIEGGTYVGFDRFGLEAINSDENRVKSMLKLIERGASTRLLVAHDTVWCWLGKPFPPNPIWRPSRFSQDVIPMLKAGGATDEHIDQILVQNPRRYFAGEPLPALR